jgi:hypothetical protein
VAEFNFQVESFDISIPELRPSRGYHWRTDFSDSEASQTEMSLIRSLRSDLDQGLSRPRRAPSPHALSFDEFRCGSVANVEARAFTSSDWMQQSMRGNVNRAYTYEK